MRNKHAVGKGTKIQTTYPMIKGGRGKIQRCPCLGKMMACRHVRSLRWRFKGIFPVAKTARAIYIYILPTACFHGGNQQIPSLPMG